MTLHFDAETNGLIEELTGFHCLVIYDDVTDKTYVCDPENLDIEVGVKMLMQATRICGHNIIAFDIPAIKKIYPWFEPKGEILDTLVISRVTYPELKNSDYQRVVKGLLPGRLRGSYSLEAWGYRMGHFKGSYDEGWDKWTPAMTEYCIQDVRVCYDLYSRMKKNQSLPNECLKLEHKVMAIIAQQMLDGFPFDIAKAEQLAATLASRRAQLADMIVPLMPAWYVPDGAPFTPKRADKRCGYVKGAEVQKLKRIEFNPNSRQHIARYLINYKGWEPTIYTENSNEPKVDDEILQNLPWREAKMIAAYMMVCKRLSQVAEGNRAWIKYYNERTGRIHGYVNPNGAVTGRMTHNSPNVAQTPAIGVPYGRQCRELWHAIPGYKIVGCDASGLEARMLAHFLYQFDGGEYIDIVLNGDKKLGTDVHGRNMKALGLTKPQAKRWFYAWCYGAGDDLLGGIVGGTAKDGAKYRKKFLKAMPAIAKLITRVQEQSVKNKSIRGLDKRKVSSRSSHSALNTLLQGAGALVMKQALVLCDERLKESGIDYQHVANIHDEFQIMAEESRAEEVGEIARQAIIDAGKHFNIRIPLDAEYAIGDNWAETH